MRGKSLGKNYIYNTSYQILAIIAPLITTPYVSRVLEPSGVGIYNYIYAIAYVFSLVCLMGTNIYSQREIAYVQDDSEKISLIFYEVMFIKFVAFVLSSVLYFIVMCVFPENMKYLFVAYFYVLASFFDISWLFQGMEDFPKTVIRNSVVKIVGIVLVFIVVKTPNDIGKYILILSLSTFIGQLYMWLYVPKIINKCNLKKINITRHVKPTFILFLPAIATYIYTSLDKVMLGMMSTSEEVGFYSQAEKVVKLVMTIVTSLGVVLIPRMANLIRQQEWRSVTEYIIKSIRFVVMLSLPMMLGLIVISDKFIPLFLGPGYEKSVVLLRMFAPLILIIGIASITGQAVLVSLNKQTYYTITVVCGSIANCALNYLLIPQISSYGATIATIVAEFVVTGMQIYGIRNLINIKNLFIQIYKYIFSSIIMLFAILVLKMIIVNVSDFAAMAMEIIIGSIVYLLTLLFYKDTLVHNMFNRMKTIIRKNKQY